MQTIVTRRDSTTMTMVETEEFSPPFPTGSMEFRSFSTTINRQSTQDNIIWVEASVNSTVNTIGIDWVLVYPLKST